MKTNENKSIDFFEVKITYSIIFIRRISRRSMFNVSDSDLAVIINSVNAIRQERIIPNRNI